MGLYIPSLKLPNKDYGKMVVTIYPDGSVVEYLGDIGRDFGTAVPVSPHGRLIDADTLCKDLTRFYDGEVTARRLIDEQPTIIPAEGGRVMDCRGCKYYHNLADNHCFTCDGSGYTRPSNADRIRAMTDKELVNTYFYILNNILKQYIDSRQGLLKWLEQEYKNDL